MRRQQAEQTNRRAVTTYVSPEINAILAEVERATGDHALVQSIHFGPTALTHIRRLIETGGTIIADTTLLADGIDEELLGSHGAKVICFIDDLQVRMLAQQRQTTRAEVAVDYALSVPGMKLMVVGSAPTALNRMLRHRAGEPMNEVCVLAGTTGFAGVVQTKEKLIDSSLQSIVIRGKKGGVPATAILINAILKEIAKGGHHAI